MNDNEKKQHRLMMREVAQNALEASSVVIVRARVDYGFPILFISDNVKRYGYSAEEIMRNQTPCVQFVYPDDMERLNQEFRAYLKAGIPEYVREYRFVTATNKIRWVEERLTIEWDEESGQATHCQGIQIDITERKQAEEALAESLEAMRVRANRLDALNQLTGKLISASDEQEVFRILKQQLNTVIDADRISVGLPSHNDEFLQIFVLDDQVGTIKTDFTYSISDTLIGRVYSEGSLVFTPDHAESDDLNAQRLLQRGWHTSIIVPLTFGGQSLGTFNILSETPNSYSDDDVQLLRQIAVPVAAKLANQKLVTEMQLVREVVAGSSAVVFRWAPEDGFPITFVTDNVRQFGYTAEELISGRVHYLSLVHPDEHSTPDEHIEFWESFEGEDYVDQYRIISPKGKIYWVEDHTTVARDENGKLIHLQSLIQDITPDKLVEEKLRFANTVIENSPVVLLRWYATEGYPIDFVTKNIDQFGYSAEELASDELSYAEIVHPEDLEWQTEEIARLIEVGIDEFTLTYRIVTKDRQVRWVEDRTTIERDETGEITHLQGMILDISERKQAEETLKLTQYSVDSAVDMIFWLTSDGRFTYVNESAYKSLGYMSVDELLSKSILDIVPNYSQESWEELWEEVKLEGVLEFDGYSQRSPAQNGTHFPIQITASYHKVGQYEYLFAFCRDITERREAAEALHASEKQLRLMLDKLPNAVCMVRFDGVLVYVNQAYSDLFGITPEMMSQVDIRNLYKDSTNRDAFVQLITRDGFVNKWETELLRNDGSSFAVSISSQLLPYHGETVTLSSIFDLTEKVEAEKVLMRARDVAQSANVKLKKSEAMIRSVLDQIPIFTTLARFDGSIIYINHAGEAMFGGTGGNRSRSALPFYKDLQDREELIRVLRRDGVVQDMLCDMVYTNGEVFHAKVSSRVIEYDGEDVLLTCIFDLTEQIEYEETLKRARDAAEAANEAKSDFLASMSHELRTPLNGILGYTQLLQRDTTLNKGQKNDIHTIHESGEHLLMLINDILDLSKIEARKLELHEGIVYTQPFLQGVINIIRMKAMEKHLEFDVELAADLPPAFIADAMRVRQILFNLLGNAVKFTQRGGVTFCVQIIENDLNGLCLHFIVEDTGIGIQPEKLEKIFDPFVQVGDKMSRVAGTGLGLAISQQLVEKMRGKIEVASRLEAGSTFRFILPLTPIHDVQPDEQTVKRVDRYINTQKTVLIVDDNSVNRAVVRDWLKMHRFTTVEAENGRSALTLSKTVSPDLILTDLVMPELDGYELVRHVRAGESVWDIHTPIIAMSASASAEMCAETLRAGCDGYISKPVQMNELLDNISGLLQIEWVYSELNQQNGTSGFEDNVVSLSNMLFPAKHNLDNLIEMVEIGDMMGVTNYANRLVGDDSDLSSFVQRVEQLADDFEDEMLLQFLQRGKNC